MKHILLTALFAVAHACDVDAQELGPAPTPLVADVFLHAGMLGQQERGLTPSEMLTLAPGSRLLDRDFSSFGFTTDDQYQGHGTLDMGIGLNLFRKHPGAAMQCAQLRLGVSYSDGLLPHAAYFKENTAPYDTLVSTSTGIAYPLDTTRREHVTLEQTSQRIGLDVSLIFRSREFGRFSFYGGAGLSAGLTFNARTTVFHSAYTVIDGHYPVPYPPDLDHNTVYEEERFHQDGAAWAAIYLPIGANLVLGRTNSFWKHVNLFTECRFALRFDGVPELDSYTTLGIQSSFGLRVTLAP